MATSADTSFRLIASSKRLLTRGQIAEALARATSSGSSLEAAVDELGFLSAEDFERIVSTRERHGRDCSSCGDVTFLLPKQRAATTPCEHCGAKLVLTQADQRPRPGSGRPPAQPGPGGAPPAGPRPTGRRIKSQAERAAEREEAERRGPPPSAAHEASRDAAAASASAVGDITFSAPTEELASQPPTGDPLAAATPPGAGAADDDELEFRSVAFDASEVAEARAAAAREDPAPPPASEAPPREGPPREGPPRKGPPRKGPPRKGPPREGPAGSGAEPPSESEAPTKPPTRVEGPGGAAAGSPRDLRIQGGGFGYEPPEELAPRPPRPGLGSPVSDTVSSGDEKEGAASPPPASRTSGAFGYEPPEELAPRGARPGMGAAVGGAVGGVVSAGGGAPPPAGDDDRFMPPAAHMAAHGSKPEEVIEVPPLREDIGRILKLPLEKEGIGMLVLGTFMVSLSSMIPLTPFTLLPALAFMAYPITFLIDCTRYGSLGRERLPNFPDFDMGLIGNLWRSIQVYFACALPAIVVLVPLFFLVSVLGSSARKAGPALPVFSIGEGAYDARRGEADWHVSKGTDVSGTVFLEPGTDSEVSLGGEWTVIGFLNRSNADDTGTSADFTDMGAASALGTAGIPGFQAHDLDRVGRALAGRVKVYAAYADPDERIIQGRFPWLRPDGGQSEWEDEEVDPDDPQAARQAAARDALDKASQKATFNRARAIRDNGIYVSSPFEGLQVLKTSDWTFPGPFEGIKPLPVVYVLNAQGQVAMEYGAGVDDEQLYGDLENLMRGGPGGASRKSLPPHIKPPQGFGLASLAAGGGVVVLLLVVIPLVLAGYFYWPAAQLVMVTFDSGTMAFNYPIAIRAIRAGFKDYLALVGIIVGLSFVGALVGSLIRGALFFAPGFVRGGLGSFVSSVFYFYSQVVGAYAIGRYYYANKEAIGWFGGR